MHSYQLERLRLKSGWLRRAVFCLAAVSGAGSLYADFSFTLSETQTGLLLSGTGSVDISGLNEIQTGGAAPFTGGSLWPNYTFLSVGVGAVAFFDIGLPSEVTGPDVIGDGIDDFLSRQATSGTGDAFGFDNSFAALIVPEGYASGETLSGSGWFAGVSLNELGIALGQYVWDTDGGTITLNVVPEYASSGAFLGGAAGLFCLSRSLRRNLRRTNV